MQEVEITLRFLGRFELPPPEQTPEERARQEQLRKQRTRNRARYQQIKSGEHAVGQPYALTCKCCGKPFEARRSSAQFCSRTCQRNCRRQETEEDRRRTCTCGICGAVFTTTRKDVKYCGKPCREEAKRRRLAEEVDRGLRSEAQDTSGESGVRGTQQSLDKLSRLAPEQQKEA